MSKGRHKLARRILRFFAFLGVLAALLFGSAGTWRWPFGWVFMGVMVASLLTMVAVMDRDLLTERVDPAPGGMDRRMRRRIMPFYALHVVIAGLDAGRFHRSGPFPLWLHLAGLALLLAGMALSMSAIRVNRFFSPVIRIQTERGHRLVDAGPYRWIRHPGYAASILTSPGGALLLGSWWSLAALGVPYVLLLRRTVLEDRFLRENLPGYADYAARVRYRLIPGVW